MDDDTDANRNGGSIPPRLPYLSQVVKQLQTFSPDRLPGIGYTIVALSYRGFWTSSGRPSQKGIELDAKTALDWVTTEYSNNGDRPIVILWGQSIGAGVALTAAAHYYQQQICHGSRWIAGMLLETPFLSIEEVLLELYPQRWLPYRYLGPFLRSHWDAVAALDGIATVKSLRKPKVIILHAGKDELVPERHVVELENQCIARGFHVGRRVITGAFHGEIMTKGAGRTAIVAFIQDVVKQRQTGNVSLEVVVKSTPQSIMDSINQESAK